MKKYYPWLALVVALTLNTPGEPATAEYNAVKTSDGEEVVVHLTDLPEDH